MAEELEVVEKPEPTSLNDVLSGEEKPAVAAEPAQPVQQQAEPERPRGPDGKFLQAETKPEPKAEPKPEPVKSEPAKPQEELTAKEKAFLAAAHEERRKRQDMEREIAELRQRAQQPQQPQEQPKAFVEDPDGTLQRFEQGILGKVEQVVTQTRVHTSEAMARQRYQDYDEKVAIFSKICQSENGKQYFQAALAAPDPAEFVYRTVKNIQDQQAWAQAGGAEGMRAQIVKEERAKWEAEQTEKGKAKEAAVEALPGSLSNVQGSGFRSAPVWTGPETLDSILKH